MSAFVVVVCFLWGFLCVCVCVCCCFFFVVGLFVFSTFVIKDQLHTTDCTLSTVNVCSFGNIDYQVFSSFILEELYLVPKSKAHRD